MEQKKQSINLTIAGKNYPFSVNPEDEEVMRLAVKKIAEKISIYRQKYRLEDEKDALAIVSLEFVVQLVKEKRKDVSGKILGEIQVLSDQIDEYIKTNIDF